MLECYLRLAIRVSIQTGARLKVWPPLDIPLSWMLIVIIGCYRRVLSPWLGQQCLFDPSCSRFAETALRQHGWNRGVVMASQRLEQCRGNFTIRHVEDGIELLTSDGVTYQQKDLSEFIRRRYGADHPAFSALQASMTEEASRAE